eukprot:gene38776-47891_t
MLMMAGKYDDAMDIAKKQVVDGVHKFVKIAVTEPEVAKVPFMLDASKFEIVLAGLKWYQGKPIVNSISLKVGEALFKEHATLLKKHGAAVVVMAFDEQGQAATKEEKIRICKRSYDILVNEVKFPPEDIIFDPNVLTIGTGMEEHANYGVDFINACKLIKEQCPFVKISGGISNLSFGFRGVGKIRESIHSVFLHHAILESGMDVGIVNAHEMIAYNKLEPDLRVLCENLVFNKTELATEQMLERTTWEKEAIDSKKNKTPLRQKPRVVVKRDRVQFPCDDYPEVQILEPPAPTSFQAQNKVPASYRWHEHTHSVILACRYNKMADFEVKGKAAGWSELQLDWSQPADKFPEQFPYYVRGRDSLRSYISQLFSTELTMYDGAMGTMIQKQSRWLDETAFRGERFADWKSNVKGNNDLLSLTRPAVIKNIYLEYLRSGSLLIGTKNFSSTIRTNHSKEYRRETAKINATRTAGKNLSHQDSSVRNVTFDELVDSYLVIQVDGGADVLIVETIFDTLNSKAAALFAIGEYLEYAETTACHCGRHVKSRTALVFELHSAHSAHGSLREDGRLTVLSDCELMETLIAESRQCCPSVHVTRHQEYLGLKNDIHCHICDDGMLDGLSV